MRLRRGRTEAGHDGRMTPQRTLPAALAVTVLVLTAGCSDEPVPAAAPPSTGSAAGAAPPPSTPAGEQATPSAPSATEQRSALGEAVTLTDLTGRSTTLTVDRRALDALGAVGVQLSPVGQGRLQPSGSDTSISFDVTGGTVTADAAGTPRLTGQVQHAGGLSLSALGRSVTVDEFVLDADQEALTAEVAGRRLPLLPVDLADARIEREGEGLVVTDDAVALHPDAARALADQLGLPALPALELGRLQTVLVGR